MVGGEGALLLFLLFSIFQEAMRTEGDLREMRILAKKTFNRIGKNSESNI